LIGTPKNIELMKFLINTFTHWDEPPRARHQVANALALKNQVVFVAANKLGIPTIKMCTVSANLNVLTPYFPIGNKIRYRLPVINELYQYWLFRKLNKKYKDFKVINFDFTASKIHKYFSDVIFYCNDSFIAISKNINPGFIARYHEKCMSEVAVKAKFCVAVSDILKENLKKYNTNSYEIPLGSPDIMNYNLTVNKSPSNKKIINVGLVGFIKTYSISYNLINSLLENEDLVITLIGPIEGNFLNYIKRKEKLIIKGSLFGKKLYDEINKFDVAIAPYSSTITNNDQIGVGIGSKTYQYLALGKPVVISYMNGLNKINLPDGFIYIAMAEEDFAPLIYKANKENSESLIQKRIDFAKNNTWEKRMDKLISYYEEFESIEY
jgi:hypothetical protein